MRIPAAGFLTLANLAATDDLAKSLAPLLRSGDMLALEGSLGAGKTTFARALLVALGVGDDVPSPTFTLLQTYETPRFAVTHFDLYRLKSADELEELGWDDILAEGVVLVEWPERAGNRLPDDRLVLRFELQTGGQRICHIAPHGRWAERLKESA